MLAEFRSSAEDDAEHLRAEDTAGWISSRPDEGSGDDLIAYSQPGSWAEAISVPSPTPSPASSLHPSSSDVRSDSAFPRYPTPLQESQHGCALDEHSKPIDAARASSHLMARRPGIDTSEYYDPFDEKETESSRGLGGIAPCAHIGLATAVTHPQPWRDSKVFHETARLTHTR